MSGQINSKLSKEKINSKVSGLLLIAIIFPLLLPAGADITVQNQRNVPITVCSNGVIGPTTLQPSGTYCVETHVIPKPNGLLTFWACNVGDSKCINTQDPKATLAILEIRDDNSYRLSTQQGYNFAAMITCLGCATCEIITCKANLNDCPHELRIRHPGSSDSVAACKCPPFPEGSESDSQLYLAYSSLFADSDCQMPSSWDELSSDSKTCLDSRDLLVSFSDS